MSTAKARVLIVDDEPDIREILQTLLTDSGFACTTAPGVDDALLELGKQEFEIVFTDIRMPGRPASDLLREIKIAHPRTLVVMITGLNTAEAAIETIRMGAFDYIVKPFNLNDVLAAADRAMDKRRVDQANREFQEYFEEMAGDRAAQAGRLFYSMTQILVRILELRIPFDVGHSANVAEIARHIAFELKMTQDGIRKVHLAALLHDVGMIPMEDLLLQKPGSLTPEEYRHIQEHSVLAETVLRPIVDDAEVLKYIRHHHERYDGTGYPDQLKGNIIPLGARIIAVAEAFDAMTRSRPYRKALPPETAAAELRQRAETQFDPQVVAAFARIVGQLAPELQHGAATRP